MNIACSSIRTTEIAVIIFTILLCQSAIVASSKTEEMIQEPSLNQLKALDRLSEPDRSALLESTGKNLRRIQEVLLNQLTSTDNEVRCYAAFLLGEYRFPQAADSLARIINLEAKVRRTSREWYWDQYPVVEALIKIGNPSIAPVIRNLRENDDEQVRELSLKVLYFVEGKDSEITALCLRRASEAEHDPAKRARLQSAANKLRDPAFGSPSQQ